MRVKAEARPDKFTVAEPCSVQIVVVGSEDLSVGDTVECQFPNSWSMVTGPSFTRALQTADPSGPHFVSARAPGCNAAFECEVRPRHLNHPAGPARHGRHIIAKLVRGTVPAGRDIVIGYANTLAPYIAETETVWVRMKGIAPAVAPALTILPGPGAAMRLIAPSGVEPGELFDVLAVSLDRFENASATRFENMSLALSDGTALASGIGFTGSARIPVRLDREGVFRFQMGETVSNAVRVGRGCRGPYWGDLHIHTKLSDDAQGTNPYAYAHGVSGLDFGAAADHWESLGEEGYRIIEEWAAGAPAGFVPFLADERNPHALTGHHNIYFRDVECFRQNRRLAGQGSAVSPEEEADALRRLDPSRAMLIPHHTGIAWGALPKTGIGSAVDWDAWDDPRLRPVVEIYSHHGQSELYCPQHQLAYEFNRMRNPERRANTSVPGPFYVQDYWMAGRRVGVIASSDEHSGQGGRRHGGTAAVLASERSREAIFDAIRARRCYATTGERILVDFSVDGAAVGQCLNRRRGDTVNISLRVWGTALLVRVEILRFRFGVDSAFRTIFSEAPRRGSAHLAGGPVPELMDAACEVQDTIAGPCMFYARVVQQPLDWPGMAWTSPVWVDVDDGD